MRVVVIEDSPELVEIIRRALEKDGMDVHASDNAERGLELVREVVAEAVVIDVGLPGMNGVEACRQLRTFSDAYVIMLTGRAAEVDRLVGLAVGADDYMTKPFFARELVARIHAMARRPRAVVKANRRRVFGALSIDPDTRQVEVDNRSVELSKTEYEVLDALSSEPQMSLSRGQLLERVWGPGWFGDDHVIDVHVSNLRRKLGDRGSKPRYIQTVRGYGYRMGSG